MLIEAHRCLKAIGTETNTIFNCNLQINNNEVTIQFPEQELRIDNCISSITYAELCFGIENGSTIMRES